MERKRGGSSHFVNHEGGNMLRDVKLNHERWVRWFHNLLNTNTPVITEALDQWPVNTRLEVQPTMQEVIDAIRFLFNEKAVGPDGIHVELCKLVPKGNFAHQRGLLNIVVC